MGTRPLISKPDLGNGDGNGKLGYTKLWIGIAGLIFSIACVLGGMVYGAGQAKAQLKADIDYLRDKVATLEAASARRDVMELRLANIERGQAEHRVAVEKQNDLLRELDRKLPRR